MKHFSGRFLSAYVTAELSKCNLLWYQNIISSSQSENFEKEHVKGLVKQNENSSFSDCDVFKVPNKFIE